MSQTRKKLMVEFKGRVVAVNDENNDAELEAPIFLPDEDVRSKRAQEIGPKTEESWEKALESQSKINEIYNSLTNQKR